VWRSREEHLALAHGIFDELDELTRSAPELLEVIRMRLSQQLLMPPGAPGSGTDGMADSTDEFWRAQVVQRDGTITTLSSQLDALQRSYKSLQEAMRRSDAAAAAARKQLQGALASGEEAALAAAEGTYGSDVDGGGIDTAHGGAGFGSNKIMAMLMRKYKDELGSAHARIDELEAMLASLESRGQEEMAALRRELSMRDAMIARHQADLHSARQQLDAYRQRAAALEATMRENGVAVKEFVPPSLPALTAPIADSTYDEAGENADAGIRAGLLRRSSTCGLGASGRLSFTGGTTGGAASGLHGSAEGSAESVCAANNTAAAGLEDVVGAKGGSFRMSKTARRSSLHTVGAPTASNSPHFNNRQAVQHKMLNFGSLTLDLENSKPMSITFLFRTISQLMASKLVADERAILAGKMPLSMPDFVSFQMISLYGAGKIAAKYVQEMVVGLKQYRKEHPRIALFARLLSIFDGESVDTPVLIFLCNILVKLLQLLETDKKVTSVTSLSFFKRYDEVSLLFVPVEYVARALELSAEGDASLQTILFDFLRDFAEAGNLFADEAACMHHCKVDCAEKRMQRRCALIAPRVEGGFVNLDQMLLSLSSRYGLVWESRKAKTLQVFRKFDFNGDGVLSMSEFTRMLTALSSSTLTRAQLEQMYNTLMGLGDGQIKPEDLQQILYVMTARQKAEVARQSGLEFTEADTIDHDFNLAKLTRTWESMRNTVSLENDPERWAYYNSPPVISLIIQIQAGCRRLLVTTRKRAAEIEEPEQSPQARRASLTGERVPRHPGASFAEVGAVAKLTLASWRGR